MMSLWLEIVGTISEKLSEDSFRVRILGPSGIGKSRIVYEACRAAQREDNVVYYNAAHFGDAILREFALFLDASFDGFLILDNCELGTYKALDSMLPAPISLIGVDSAPKTSGGKGELVIPGVSEEVIGGIVRTGWPDISKEQLSKIVEYADGFPLIAATLAQDAKAGVSDLGNLRDDEIKARLLGTDATDDDLCAIEALSLFDSLGFENQMSDQYRYVSEVIAKLSPEQFYRSITRFHDRRLIEVKGDYKRVRPFPLGIRMAADWWRENSVERITEVIQQLDPALAPPHISEAFCNSVARLDFVSKAVEITNELFGTNSPFIQADLLKSEWGSRLFRAFTEVNPLATTRALYQATRHESIDDLYHSYKGDVRRNLYWSFEKLCFRSETYEEAALVLLRFAAAENESWGNNCTELFKQLASPYLSGTQALPESRFRVIRSGLADAEGRVQKVAFDALVGVIDCSPRTRMMGAESQGLGQQLEEWQPSFEEVRSYREEALALIHEVAASNEGLRQNVLHSVGIHLRGLVSGAFGEGLITLFDFMLKLSGGFWPEAVDEIRSIKNYDTDGMPEEVMQQLLKWEEALAPEDMSKRIALIIDIPSWDHIEDEDGELIDESAVRAVEFAREVADQLPSFLQYANQLVDGELRKGFAFGSELAGNNSDHSYFMDCVLRALASTPNPGGNPTLVAGYLSTLRALDYEVYSSALDRMYEDPSLNRFFVYSASIGGVESHRLWQVLDLLKQGFVGDRELASLSLGRCTSDIDPAEMSAFLEEGLRLDSALCWRWLEVLAMYVHNDSEKELSLRDTTRNLFSALDFGADPAPGTMDLHHWKSLASGMIVDCDHAGILLIVRNIFSLVARERSSSIQSRSIGDILELLIVHGHSNQLLDNVAAIFERDDDIEVLLLGYLLTGSHRRDNRSFLADMPIDDLIAWGDNYPSFGKTFVAQSSPLYDIQNDEVVVHPLTERILNEWGDDEEVLRSISSYAGIKVWSGSRIPDLECEKSVYEALTSHSILTVRDWAREYLGYVTDSIEAESRREAAHDFGIY